MHASRSLLVPLSLVATCVAGGCAHPAAPARVYTAVADDMPAAGPAVPPVYVHLVAGQGAVLQRLSTRDDEWKDVCTAPCDGWVPAFGGYRVSGGSGAGGVGGDGGEGGEGREGREPSAAFTLPGPPGTSVTLKADDDGHVWTRDSVELRARRGGAAASAAGWVMLGAMLRR